MTVGEEECSYGSQFLLCLWEWTERDSIYRHKALYLINSPTQI